MPVFAGYKISLGWLTAGYRLSASSIHCALTYACVCRLQQQLKEANNKLQAAEQLNLSQQQAFAALQAEKAALQDSYASLLSLVQTAVDDAAQAQQEQQRDDHHNSYIATHEAAQHDNNSSLAVGADSHRNEFNSRNIQTLVQTAVDNAAQLQQEQQLDTHSEEAMHTETQPQQTQHPDDFVDIASAPDSTAGLVQTTAQVSQCHVA